MSTSTKQWIQQWALCYVKVEGKWYEGQILETQLVDYGIIQKVKVRFRSYWTDWDNTQRSIVVDHPKWLSLDKIKRRVQ